MQGCESPLIILNTVTSGQWGFLPCKTIKDDQPIGLEETHKGMAFTHQLTDELLYYRINVSCSQAKKRNSYRHGL